MLRTTACCATTVRDTTQRRSTGMNQSGSSSHESFHGHTEPQTARFLTPVAKVLLRFEYVYMLRLARYWFHGGPSTCRHQLQIARRVSTSCADRARAHWHDQGCWREFLVGHQLRFAFHALFFTILDVPAFSPINPASIVR